MNLTMNKVKYSGAELSRYFDLIFSARQRALKSNTPILPSVWNEQNRSIPSEFTSKPGKLDLDNSPFWREVLDCMSPLSPVREVAVMKSNQVGFTQIIIEGTMGYVIAKCPQPVLYVSADKDLAEMNMSMRVDALLKTCNLQDKIRPSIIKRGKNNKTGDTKSRKEFAGGFIAAFGVKNPNKLRQVGYSMALCDEIDTYDVDLKGQGDPIELIKRRTDAFSQSRKLVYGSTPLIKNASHIERLWKEGDQCYYNVPCPVCGKMQRLVFGDGTGAGLKYEVRSDGSLDYKSIYYQCENGCKITEERKYDMLIKGKWIPTAIPRLQGMRSFHISALYSNFFSWKNIVEAWLSTRVGSPEAQKAKLKQFYNNVLGEPWEEEEKTIDYRQVWKNCRQYFAGIVPDSLARKDNNGPIAVLTAAIDVNGQQDKAEGWLAFEIKAHCAGGQSYSVCKCEIHGVTDKGGNAWQAARYLLSLPWKTEDGREYFVNLCGVDIGFKPEACYSFVNSADHIIPIAGKGRQISDKIFWKHKTPMGERWTIDTVHFKNVVADRARLVWDRSPELPQPHGFLNFPDSPNLGGVDSTEISRLFGVTIAGGGYDRDYFLCYGSEAPQIERQDPSDEHGRIVGWRKRGSRAKTHFWDVTVYNFAVRDIYLSEIGAMFGVDRADPDSIIAKIANYTAETNEQWLPAQ